MDKVRVGVIGCGYWGPNLIRNFYENQQAELVAVADVKPERLAYVQKTYPRVQGVLDYRELFQLGLDAAVIATPPLTHYAIAKDCLEHELHLLIEKPLTTERQQAADLCWLAAAKKRTLMVGHTFIFNSSVRALKQMIENGDLGEIYYIDTARLNLGLFQRGLNVLWDLAPHDISILLYLLGQDPVSVNAQGMSCVLKETHDIVYMNLVFPNNLLAHVHVSWLDPCKVRRVTVVGSKKMVVFNDIEAQEKLRIYDKGVDAPNMLSNYGDFITYRSGDIIIPNINMVEPLRQECQHFLQSIIEGKQPFSCGEDGLKVVSILESAQKSLMNSGHMERII